MANPITCFVAHESNIKIVIQKKINPKIVDPVDFNGTLSYTIIDKDLQFDISKELSDDGSNAELSDDEINKMYREGFISPLHKVTLPPHAKEKAGIRDDAKYYAYVHPPPKLCDMFENFNFDQGKDDFVKSETIVRKATDRLRKSILQPNPRPQDSPLKEEEKKARHKFCAALFSVCGAFIYFDEWMGILSVNAISPLELCKEESAFLSFSGPFDLDSSEIKNMSALGRIQPLRPRPIHESGFVACVGNTI